MKTIVVMTMFVLLGLNIMAGTYTLSPQYMNTDVSSSGATYSGHPLRVGLITSGTDGRSAVLVFAMPKIPFGETITGATFSVNVADIPGTATFNGDLYSLGTSSTGVLGGPDDYYQGVYGDYAYGVPLQNDFLTSSTPVGNLSASAAGNAAIATDLQNQIDAGATQGSYYLLSFNPDFTTAWDADEGWDISAEQDPNRPSLTIVTSPSLQLGRVLIEYWTGIPYSGIDDLTSSPNYPSMPNSREYSTVMEIPQNLASNSGDRLRGYFDVPTTGNYTFAIASDNASSLLFSTNNNPADATQIASVAGSTGYQVWNTYPTQVSGPIYLTAGQICYIESLHKQGSGGGNLSIGWMPPGASSISLMPATNVAPYEAGVDYATNAISSLIQPFGHPRLMISPAAIKRLAEAVTPGTPQYNANQAFSWGRISNVCTSATTDLMPMGDTKLSGPLIGATYVVAPTSGPILTAARALQNRVYVLSLYYLVESQLDPTNSKLPLALNQIYGELQNAQTWGQNPGEWDTNNQLDLAEMAHAYAIGYDWCYSGWTPAQRAFLVNTISKQALAEDDGGDGNTHRKGNQLAAWPFTDPVEGNWGIVCNGGAALGALAILGDETTGPTGLTFNFSDSEASNYDLPAQHYLGLKYNEPLYSYPENTPTDETGHYPTDMLWFDSRVVAPGSTTPLSTYYSNSGVISLRSAWGNPNALFAGIKAGYNANVTPYGSSHEMMQLGGFVFDALGVRWAEDLGADLANYGTPYFNTNATTAGNPGNRWQFYRCRSEGNNTLVINPTLDGGQYTKGTASITNFESRWV
jgi:hypothetical protein